MYYGASLFTSINPSFCSWVLLFLNVYDLKTSVEPSYRDVLRPTAKFQIVKEVGGAVSCESATELENPLKLTGFASSKLVKPELLIFRNVVHPFIDHHLNHPMI